MYLLLFLHILTMFTAVSLAAGGSILMLVSARRGDRAVVATMSGMRLDRVIPPLYMLGGLFGLATALTFGYSLLAPWMIIAYLLFAALTALGILYSGPLMGRLHAAATDPGGEQAFAELTARFQVDTAISLLGIALIVADMVFKPF